MSTPAPAKVCMKCGVDVSTKPRVKDAQGRYLCQPCAAKAAPAAGGSQPAKPAPPKDLLTQLIDEAVQKVAELCPHCQNPLQKGAKICVGCGTDLATGKKLRTRHSTLDDRPT